VSPFIYAFTMLYMSLNTVQQESSGSSVTLGFVSCNALYGTNEAESQALKESQSESVNVI
jgi:hypothetical protein